MLDLQSTISLGLLQGHFEVAQHILVLQCTIKQLVPELTIADAEVVDALHNLR